MIATMLSVVDDITAEVLGVVLFGYFLAIGMLIVGFVLLVIPPRASKLKLIIGVILMAIGFVVLAMA